VIERYAAELRAPGGRVFPSLANFVLVDCGRPSAAVYEQLLRRGVIVRPMAAWGLPDHLRISVGRDEDTARVIGALNDVLAS
jgi:histidinol-phosphate aminotransferase